MESCLKFDFAWKRVLMVINLAKIAKIKNGLFSTQTDRLIETIILLPSPALKALSLTPSNLVSSTRIKLPEMSIPSFPQLIKVVVKKNTKY